jgi:hypothetical protein
MFGGRFAISDVRRENRRCPVELAAGTLAETAGKFRLNAELPIPFDGWGRMEVDLLCAPSRIAIELDGGQHLATRTPIAGAPVLTGVVEPTHDYLIRGYAQRIRDLRAQAL